MLPLAVALGLSSFACGQSEDLGRRVAEEDERGSIGVPPPAGKYCESSGGTLEDEQCVFTDGTSCEMWSFYEARCGQAHSYCNTHGGQIENVIEDQGSFTASYAVCDLNGTRCKDDAFARSGKCE